MEPYASKLLTGGSTTNDTSETTVRAAELPDAAAIARIYNQGIEERVATFEIEPRSEDQIRRLLAERDDRFPQVVAERAGRVVAWAGASPYP